MGNLPFWLGIGAAQKGAGAGSNLARLGPLAHPARGRRRRRAGDRPGHRGRARGLGQGLASDGRSGHRDRRRGGTVSVLYFGFLQLGFLKLYSLHDVIEHEQAYPGR